VALWERNPQALDKEPSLRSLEADSKLMSNLQRKHAKDVREPS